MGFDWREYRMKMWQFTKIDTNSNIHGIKRIPENMLLGEQERVSWMKSSFQEKIFFTIFFCLINSEQLFLSLNT